MREKLCRAAPVVITVLACLWLGAFPLASDLTYTHITHTKWVIALCLGGATLLLGGGLRLFTRQKIDPVRVLALLYFGWVALSAWQGVYADSVNGEDQLTVLWGARRYEGIITQLCYLGIFLGMSAARPRMRPVRWAVVAGVTLYCALTAAQYTGANPLGFYPGSLSILTNYEFQGTLGNIDMDSGYLLLALPLGLGGFVFSDKKWRWAALGLSLLGEAALLLT